MRSKKLLIVYLALLVIVLLTMGQLLLLKRQADAGPRDFAQIREEGVMRVVTAYSPTDYYISGDSVLGFQYELCQAIARLAGVEIQIRLETSLATSFELLTDRRVDVIAQNIPVTTDNKVDFLFTEPIVLDRQVLVQRMPEGEGADSTLIRDQLDLAGKTVYIPKDSPAKLRLRNLGREIGDTIYVVEDELYSSEQLVMRVAKGEIDYVVCDQYIADYLKGWLPEIDAQTNISFTQFQSWAVRPESVELRDSLNHWLERLRADGVYERLYERYYR